MLISYSVYTNVLFLTAFEWISSRTLEAFSISACRFTIYGFILYSEKCLPARLDFQHLKLFYCCTFKKTWPSVGSCFFPMWRTFLNVPEHVGHTLSLAMKLMLHLINLISELLSGLMWRLFNTEGFLKFQLPAVSFITTLLHPSSSYLLGFIWQDLQPKLGVWLVYLKFITSLPPELEVSCKVNSEDLGASSLSGRVLVYFRLSSED